MTHDTFCQHFKLVVGMNPIEQILPHDFLWVLLAEITKSVAGFAWTAIATLWSTYWAYILPAFTIWVIYEVLTRFGSAHYNSDNGFSPSFNRFVGSGTYLAFQGLVCAILQCIFGDSAYLHAWPYAIHVIVFASTGLFLNAVGFWVYLRSPRF